MSEPRWTPGDWEAVSIGMGYSIRTDDHAIAYTNTCSKSAAAVRGSISQLEEERYNAHIMAHAPRMYAALETLRQVALEAARLNDQDHIRGNAVKAHKLLMALAGLVPGYRQDIDQAHATLDEARLWVRP